MQLQLGHEDTIANILKPASLFIFKLSMADQLDIMRGTSCTRHEFLAFLLLQSVLPLISDYLNDRLQLLELDDANADGHQKGRRIPTEELGSSIILGCRSSCPGIMEAIAQPLVQGEGERADVLYEQRAERYGST